MTIKCPVCGQGCVWEHEEELYRHINSNTDCKDFMNPKKKVSKESDIGQGNKKQEVHQ